jgi:hypothetical protein
MSLRQKYLRVLSGLAPVGAIGVSLLLGSTAPVGADQDPASAQPWAADHGRVSERLAAIRAAVSAVEGDEAAKGGDMRTVWWGNGGWRNGGWGWRNGGWRNGGWRNGGWRNFWRNW